MIKIIVDGNTVKNTENVNLQILQAATGEYFDPEVITQAKEMQPKVAEAMFQYRKR